MTIEQALRDLLTPGGLSSFLDLVLGIILSFCVDWIPGFTDVSPRGKRLYMLVGCIGVPLLATYGLVLVSAATPSNDLFFGALFMGLLVFVGSQAGHAREL